MYRINRIAVQEAMARVGIKTQKELARKLEVTEAQLSHTLSASYVPVKAAVVRLCELLQTRIEDIVDAEPLEAPEAVHNATGVTSIELFAGAGGIAVGLEKAGIHTLAHVEIDPTCCETLRQNRPQWNVINADVKDVDFSPYVGKIDIVTGGFPCQAFSYAGKKLGFEDTRGTLFYEFARCVKEVQPKVFWAENVRGLLSHDNGRTLRTIVDVFEQLGYGIEYKVLNANKYGVAQKRERLIIIGTRPGYEFEWPEPDSYRPVLRDALQDCPPSEGQTYSAKKKAVFDLVPPGGCWVNLPEEVAKEYMGKSYYSGGGKRGMARRISWDEACLTLTCSPSQKQTDRCHPDETRPFTVREYARIQSFPDDWIFRGGVGAKYKQIGNAVPVELARRIGVQLRKCVEQGDKKEEQG